MVESSNSEDDGGREGRSVVGTEEETLKALYDDTRAKVGARRWALRSEGGNVAMHADKHCRPTSAPNVAGTVSAALGGGGGRRLERTLVPWAPSLIMAASGFPTARRVLFFFAFSGALTCPTALPWQQCASHSACMDNGSGAV